MTLKSSSSGTDTLARQVYGLEPDAPITKEQRQNLRKAFRELPVKYKNAVRLYYGIGRSKPVTGKQVADIIGRTEEWVSVMKKKSLEALRTGKKIETRGLEELKRLRSKANCVFHGLNEAIFDDADEAIKSRRKEVDAAMVALEPVEALAIELTFGIESGKRHSLSEAAAILKLRNNHFCRILKQGLENLFAEIKMNASREVSNTAVSNLSAAEKRIEDTTRTTRREARRVLKQAIQEIGPLQGRVINLRFPLSNRLPEPFRKVSRHEGVTYQRIQQIEKEALEELSRNSKLRDFAPTR